MDAAEFMTFRSRALGLLSGSVILSTTFPIKGGIGLVLSDESHGNTCVQSLNRMQGYTAKVRTGSWPRVILFNPAVARGSTIDSVSRSIKEGNPALTEGIDGDKLVSAVYWRGQRLVMAICPTLYHRLSAREIDIAKVMDGASRIPSDTPLQGITDSLSTLVKQFTPEAPAPSDTTWWTGEPV
ncbi:hypothetical protein Pmar_PMAR013020 [Perkinsus marinus ATCC 50983]|uniref:Uncharacterized protein n=1 Tax=Perkinsus marinus (strain ATCC 50983 / TXsc) TaxID=423536 RepID=C5KQC9_PERM5|nr:hypothetical protein Pmar_PMAR013020 [Perkinsus marinus ATCC 50983]EER13314.1 hypothetical protein Pmar_PMAR013020 [Perkinsus marinus ATCC 50983]|eukprot:XP_002781519.1 hypothetical protein Pmar_PMAR013020 [Perkinsus marinus ATCC 50983]